MLTFSSWKLGAGVAHPCVCQRTPFSVFCYNLTCYRRVSEVEQAIHTEIFSSSNKILNAGTSQLTHRHYCFILAGTCEIQPSQVSSKPPTMGRSTTRIFLFARSSNPIAKMMVSIAVQVCLMLNCLQILAKRALRPSPPFLSDVTK